MISRKRLPALVLTLLALPALAAPLDKAVEFNIPAQPLSTALITFAKQTKLQIVTSGQNIEGVKTAGVSGKLSVEQALKKVLAGTGFTFSAVGEGTVAVRATTEKASSDVGADMMRVVMDTESDQKPPATPPAETEDASRQVTVKGERDRTKPFSTANRDLTRTEDDALPFQVFTAEEIELSGTVDVNEFLKERLPQNFTNTNAQVLDAGGDARLNDPISLRGWGSNEVLLLLNGRKMGPQSQGIDEDTGNKLASLRGIPMASIERIEILSSAAGALYGASATAGVINIITRKDYSGGQVSLSFRTPMDVVRANRSITLSYGTALNERLRARVSGSFNDNEPTLVGDRAGVSTMRWRQLARERDPLRLYNRSATNPSIAIGVPFGARPNIRATVTNNLGTATTAGGNLFFGQPGMQASNFTTVPAGYMGPTSSTPNRRAAFQPATYNLDLVDAAGSRSGLRSYTGAVSENASVSTGLDWTVATNWSVSVDFSHNASKSRGYPSTDLSFLDNVTIINGTNVSYRPVIPANVPTNPFGIPVQVYLIDPNMYMPGLYSDNKSATSNLSTTLSGQIGEWNGFLDLSASRNNVSSDRRIFFEPVGGWIAAFTSGAYNPFVDTSVRSPAASPAFYESYVQQRVTTQNENSTYSAALRGSGPILQLPAGAMRLTGGLDFSRSERGNSDYGYEFVNPATGLTSLPQDPGWQDTIRVQNAYKSENARNSTSDSQSLYAEATIPLLSPAQKIPLVRNLELYASNRVNRVSSVTYPSLNNTANLRASLLNAGYPPELLPPAPETAAKYSSETTSYAVGFRYTMLEGVTMRLTRSGGFKPPSAQQVTVQSLEDDAVRDQYNEVLFGAPLPDSNLNIQDPRRNNEAYALLPTQYITGGNPDLRPETTVSTNVGLILQPRWIPGLRLSIDYVENIRNDAIQLPSATQVLLLEPDVPSLVQRAAPDGHPSGVGRVTFLDRRYQNLSETSSKSVDVSISQSFRIGDGTLSFNTGASRNLSYKVQTTPTSAPVEQVRRRAGSFEQQTANNMNAQVNWSADRWGMGWSIHYLDYILADTSFLALQGSDRAPQAFEHDISMSYRGESEGQFNGWRSALAGANFTLVIKNVFDRAPRFWAQDTNRGIAPFDGTALAGRTMSLQVSKSF